MGMHGALALDGTAWCVQAVAVVVLAMDMLALPMATRSTWLRATQREKAIVDTMQKRTGEMPETAVSITGPLV